MSFPVILLEIELRPQVCLALNPSDEPPVISVFSVSAALLAGCWHLLLLTGAFSDASCSRSPSDTGLLTLSPPSLFISKMIELDLGSLRFCKNWLVLQDGKSELLVELSLPLSLKPVDCSCPQRPSVLAVNCFKAGKKKRAERRNYTCKKTAFPPQNGKRNLRGSLWGEVRVLWKDAPGYEHVFWGCTLVIHQSGDLSRSPSHSEPWFDLGLTQAG